MSEESTIRLYHRFEEALGRDMATVLMEYLDTFATKQDIADLRTEMRESFATKADLQTAMSSLEGKLYRALLTTFLVMIGTNAAVIGGVAILR